MKLPDKFKRGLSRASPAVGFELAGLRGIPGVSGLKALYYIAVVLPSPLADAVKTLQLRAHAAYHSRAALRSPPHITLRAPFRTPLDKVGSLKQVLTEFASSNPTFSVEPTCNGWVKMGKRHQGTVVPQRLIG